MLQISGAHCSMLSAGAAIIAVLRSEQSEEDHEDRHCDPANFVPGPWDNMEIQMLEHF